MEAQRLRGCSSIAENRNNDGTRLRPLARKACAARNGKELRIATSPVATQVDVCDLPESGGCKRELVMRYLVTVLCALTLLVALPQRVAAQPDHEGPTSAALVVHAKSPLPPQLMLRASYYLYLDADADNGATSDQTEPNAEEPKSAQADGEVATSESNLEEPVSSPAPGTEVPDIDTLSQRAIEHYEIQSEQSGRQGGTGGRSRGAKAGIAVGVILGATLIGVGIGAAVWSANFEL